ncbi:MAG: urea transporter [Candidatus Gracilibacteria bacterium]
MPSLKLILRGTSQVMLQNNLLTGLLFLTGIFINSWLMGVGAILGNAIGTTTGYLIKGRDEDINQGLYGFNGTLVGIAALYFFKPSISLVIATILASILSSIIMKFMHEKKLFPYTFPFIFSTWILIATIKILELASEQIYNSTAPTSLDVLSGLNMGLGQVMFQGSIITGLFFLLALLVNSQRAAVYAFIGSAVGLLIAFGFGFPLSLINIGIFGFNGVLCGITFSNEKNAPSLWALLSITLSIFIIYGFVHFDLPALTFPFVLATWITLGVKRLIVDAN